MIAQRDPATEPSYPTDHAAALAELGHLARMVLTNA